MFFLHVIIPSQFVSAWSWDSASWRRVGGKSDALRGRSTGQSTPTVWDQLCLEGSECFWICENGVLYMTLVLFVYSSTLVDNVRMHCALAWRLFRIVNSIGVIGAQILGKMCICVLLFANPQSDSWRKLLWLSKGMKKAAQVKNDSESWILTGCTIESKK